ncbi:MAG TPA: glycosyltransferase [Vicinamibacterales bacterium]|nr:glycosyltransferase [Vicinamibacterales bacterium]
MLHVVPALFGTAGIVGGAERYAFELARHMADRVPTRLVSFGSTAKVIREGNLDVRVLSGAWHVRGQRTNPFTLALMPEILNADVVHCHQHHILMSSAAAAMCRLTRRRVFATDLGGGGWDVSAYVSTDRWFDAHLHISEYSRHISGHDGNPWARVILGGVDTVKFSPGDTAARSSRVLFVGRLLAHKGVANLIAALPGTIALDIVGPLNSTGEVDSLKAQAAGKPIAFHHGVGDAALVEMYRRALCLVLPSVYRTAHGQHSDVPELLGQTLLEAMACATPVICTRVASMPEIVKDGVNGFVVEPGDLDVLRTRLLWLAGHPAEAAAMGAAGRNIVLDRFQWPQVVERCLEAYARP